MTEQAETSIPFPASSLEIIAREKAAEQGLDGDLVAAICGQASRWQPWHVEYGGIFYVARVAPLVENRILTDLTEARSRAFRWGLMGILGFRARQAGYDGPLAQLLDPSIGLSLGCLLLRGMLSSSPEGADLSKSWRTWQSRGE
jgi:hypothetical protein